MRFLRFLDALLAKRLQGCFDMGGSGVKAVVSARMARIRSSGSKMEREFGAQLRKAGIPFRKQYRVLGKPDFVVLNERIAIFCDSRFWHGYRWGRRSSRDFKVNGEFWIRKIEGNRRRDSLVNRELRKQGYARQTAQSVPRPPGVEVSPASWKSYITTVVGRLEGRG